MTTTTAVKRTSVLTAAALMMGSLGASGASAMPIGSDVGVGSSPMVLQVSVGQHRIIPGEAANTAHPQHAARNAPDLYCDKQEAKCQ